MVLMFTWDVYGDRICQNVALRREEMIIRLCVWDVCVYISCTGDEGQLGSSFLRNVRGSWGGQDICRKS